MVYNRERSVLQFYYSILSKKGLWGKLAGLPSLNIGRINVVKGLLKILPFAKAAKQNLSKISHLGFMLCPFIFYKYLHKRKHSSLVSNRS
jgi:hypothetical protein